MIEGQQEDSHEHTAPRETPFQRIKKYEVEHEGIEEKLRIRPESNPARKQAAISLYKEVSKIIKEAKKLKEDCQIKRKIPRGPTTYFELSIFSGEQEDDGYISLYETMHGRTTRRTTIGYDPSGEGQISEEVYGNRRFGPYINFWTDEQPTAQGADGNRILEDQELTKPFSRLSKRFSQVFDEVRQDHRASQEWLRLRHR